MLLVDSIRQPVSLESELGRGGEGIVYAVDGRSDVVAKLYHQSPPREHGEKLATMVSLRTPALQQVAAWPISLLHDRSSGEIIGVLMPRVVGNKPIHQLYGPKSRLAEFPRADFRFLVLAAANLARAFAVVHQHNQVVGDVNHANALVGANATVRFIDCDSFQISANGRRFLCDVGVPTHQPPELVGLPSLRGVVRTPNHDRFGLAVLVFQLLMLGRHPFAGQYVGPGEMPIERAIAEYRFAYGRRAAAFQMRPPPYTPSLAALDSTVARLFERAFEPKGATGKRPGADEWVGALERLEAGLQACANRPGHAFPGPIAGCPWCEIETRLQTRLFPLVAMVPPTRSFDLAAIWAAIEARPAPGPAPALPISGPSESAVPSEAARNAGRRRKLRRWATLLALGVGVVPSVVRPPGLEGAEIGALVLSAFVAHRIWRFKESPDCRAIREARLEARSRWRQIEVRWRSEAGDGRFLRKKRELVEARRAYLDLPDRRRRELLRLGAEGPRRQRDRFLEGFRIADLKIRGIGAGRTALLASYGVETAADVSETTLAGVPGFGPSLIDQLIDWRREIERSFQPARAVEADPADLLALDRDLQGLRSRLETTLRQGEAELRNTAESIQRARAALAPLVARARRDLDQAEADFSTL